MLTGFEKPTLFGLLFDMDDFKTNGDTAMKQIKEMFKNFATKIGLDARIYVAGNKHLPKTHGESIAQIDNYMGKRDENTFAEKFMDCVNGIGNQVDCKKHIIILTNRFNEKHFFNYKKGFMVNQMKDLDCNICVFEVRRHTEKLMNLVDEYQQKYMFIEDINLIDKFLKDILTEIGYG